MENKENKVSIIDLYKDKNLTVKQEQLNVFLNQDPPKNWVKIHPFVKNWKYLPIDKVEFLLKKFFKAYRIEVIEYKQIFNAISCHVRVHYLNPATSEWDYHDGIAAVELQTKKDTGNLQADFSNVNKGACTMALPIAKSLAIKDACDMFGSVFGANLNRKDVQPYSMDEKLLN